MNNQKNPDIGKKGESLFKNSIVKNQDGINAIMKALNISGSSGVKSYSTGGSGGKADTVLNFGQSMVAANIKSYSAGFNQATRMHVDKFISTFNIPQNIADIIKDSIIRKASNKGQPLILPKDAPSIVNYFIENGHRVVEHSLCGDEKPQLFVLYNRKKNTFHVYLMDNILCQLEEAMNVLVTRQGVIRLSKYFTIQRKGGNGAHDKREREDPNHGGNNVQVKLSPIRIEEAFQPLFSYTP